MIRLKAAVLLLLLGLPVVLSGCGEKRVLERLGFIQVVGYDAEPDNKLRVSFLLPKFGPEFGTTKQEFLTATAYSSKQAKLKAVRQTNWDLVSGQMRNLLISESLASRGIWPHVDTLVRDPTISPRVKISIVEGEASSIMDKTYEQHPGVSLYIDRLLETEINEQAIPRISFYEFERDYIDDGIDPIAPVLKDNGKNLEIAGLGLFRADKYVGKIDAEEISIFSLLYRNNKKLDVYLVLDDSRPGLSHVMLSDIKSKRTIRVRGSASGPFEVSIRIKAQGLVTEYLGGEQIASDKQRKMLERKISEKLSELAEQLAAMLQNKKADSLGLGKHVRNSMTYQAWKKINWNEELAETKISCQVTFRIQNYGKFR